MKRYIDAEKLIAEIERRIQFCEDCERDGCPDTTSSEATLKSLRSHITSLEQEQPECIYGRTLEEREKCCKFCSAACKVYEGKVKFVDKITAVWLDDKKEE